MVDVSHRIMVYWTDLEKRDKRIKKKGVIAIHEVGRSKIFIRDV